MELTRDQLYAMLEDAGWYVGPTVLRSSWDQPWSVYAYEGYDGFSESKGTGATLDLAIADAFKANIVGS